MFENRSFALSHEQGLVYLQCELQLEFRLLSSGTWQVQEIIVFLKTQSFVLKQNEFCASLDCTPKTSLVLLCRLHLEF